MATDVSLTQLRRLLGVARPAELFHYHVSALRETLWHRPGLTVKLWDDLLNDSNMLLTIDEEVLRVMCDCTSTSSTLLQAALDVYWADYSAGHSRATPYVLFLISRLGNVAHSQALEVLTSAWTKLLHGQPDSADFFLVMLRTKALPKAALASIVKFVMLWELCKTEDLHPSVQSAVQDLLVLDFLELPKEPLLCTTRGQAQMVLRVVTQRSSCRSLFAWDTVIPLLSTDEPQLDVIAQVAPFLSASTLSVMEKWTKRPFSLLASLLLGKTLPRVDALQLLSSLKHLPHEATHVISAVTEADVQSSTSMILLMNLAASGSRDLRECLLRRCLSIRPLLGEFHLAISAVGDLADDIGAVFEFFSTLLADPVVDCAVIFTSFIKVCIRQVQALQHTQGTHLNRTVAISLEQMLAVANTVASPAAKLTLLKSLSPILDLHLSQTDIVELLFVSVSDVNSEVVSEALKVLCRLSEHNPASVTGRLEQLMEHLVTIFVEGETLAASLSSLLKLRCMIREDFIVGSHWATLEPLLFERAGSSVSCEYTVALLDVLNVGIEKGLLKSRKCIDFFVKIGFENAASQVRQSSLCALQGLMRLISVPVQAKLDIAKRSLDALSSSARWFDGEHLQLVNLLGQIGVVEPPESFSRDKNDGEVLPVKQLLEELEPGRRWNPGFEQRANGVALYFAFKLFAASSSKKRALALVPRILSIMSPSELSNFLPKILPPLFVILRSTQWESCHREILAVLREAVPSLRKATSLFSQLMQELAAFSQLHHSNAETVGELLAVIRCISGHYPQETRMQCGWMSKFLVQCLWQLAANPRQLTQAVTALESVSFMLDKQLHVIVPVILQLITPSTATGLLELSGAAMSFLLSVINHQLIRNCATVIVHRATSFVKANPRCEQSRAAFDLLEGIFLVSGPFIGHMIPLVLEVASGAIHGGSIVTFLTTFRATGSFPEKKVKVPKADVLQEQNSTMIFCKVKLKNKRVRLEEIVQLLADASGIPVDELECVNGHDGSSAELVFSFMPKNPIVTVEKILSGHGFIVAKAMVANSSSAPLESHVQEISTLSTDRDWVEWSTDLTKYLLVTGKHRGLRILLPLVGIDETLDRELLVFVLSYHINGSGSRSRRRHIIEEVQNMLLKGPPMFIQEVCFGVAEFFESERATAAKPQPTTQTINVRVRRESIEAKFGIIYDQEGKNIVVTRLAPGGVGEQAGVPVGAVLLNIDGYVPRTVNEIPPLIKSKQAITLALRVVVAASQSELSFFDPQFLLTVAEGTKMHERAVFFSERILESALLARRKGTTPSSGIVDVSGEEGRILACMGRLVEQLHSLDLVWEAHSIPGAVADQAQVELSKLPPETLEFLRQWDKLLEQLFPDGSRHTTGEKMDINSLTKAVRYYHALGDMQGTLQSAKKHWASLATPYKNAIAELVSTAAFVLHDWDFYRDHLIPETSNERLDPVSLIGFQIATGNVLAAKKAINRRMARLSSMLNDAAEYGYNKAKKVIQTLQHFRQLQECISYDPSKVRERDVLLRDWRRRLVTAPPRVEEHIVALAIPSLVLSEGDRVQFYQAFFESCQSNGWARAAECIMLQLIPSDASFEQLRSAHPAVALAYVKRLRVGGNDSSAKAQSLLIQLVSAQGSSLNEEWREPLMVLGKWTEDAGDVEGALRWVHLAVTSAGTTPPSSSWRQLATLHFQLSRSRRHRHHHIVAAIEAFAKALADCETLYLTQNTLRLMSLWFTYGSMKSVMDAVTRVLESIPLTTWLHVVPQLFARIGIPVEDTRRLLVRLLANVARSYPHVIIFPLIVAERSGSIMRRRTCLELLDELRAADGSIRVLLHETAGLSAELIRVAILWTEKWMTAIHDAAKKHDNMEHVKAILFPLLDETEHPQTPHERAFDAEFGQALRRAREALASSQCDKAWSILKKVYGQLSTYVKGMRSLDVADVSPALASLKNAKMIVPGTFSLEAPPIFIAKVDPTMTVISSKQKPRRFGFVGTDGILYRFLLKGHEDLRQDERVMQVLELVNSIFAGDDKSRSHKLSIPTYNVTPLSSNVGILQWVEGTQTIYKLIEARRAEFAVPIMEECNLICQKGNLRRIDEYHGLPRNVRRQLLEYVCTSTSDEELKLICWDLNRSSEAWIEHRRCYTNSMAAMSMVGYVIGLGDRHLNNIMMHRCGSIVHIDFGDCFEVATHRPNFAEAVPFRLTRLLCRALGIGGSSGSYLQISRHVMALIRFHRESLQSILEAFLYDPLINWRPPERDTDGVSAAVAKQQEQLDEMAAAQSMAVLDDHNEWRNLLLFIQDNMPLDHEVVIASEIPANSSISDVISLVKFAIDEKNFAAAVALVQQAKDMFPELLREEQLSVDSQLLQSVCVQQSINEKRNRDANAALQRVRAKLDGSDFTPKTAIPVEEQVGRLIVEATSMDNLAEAYITGWAPFW